MADIISSPRQVDLEADLAAPRGMLLPIDDVRPAEDNLRRMAAGEDADRMMRDSVAAAGIFTPILVRPSPDGAGWRVIDGHRRLAAARLAGLQVVPVTVRASNDAEQLAIQAAANIVRAPLAPVDQWEAIQRLQERGYSITDAAHTLGLQERFARRLGLLGQLHPDILQDVRVNGLPPRHFLATVASAPQKTQAAALKAKTSWTGSKGDDRRLSWHDFSRACTLQRISRDRAVFDVAGSKLVFEEDLFAEPGSVGQFTTADVAGFMKAQEAALQQRAASSKGKVQEAEWDTKAYAPAIPKGWIPHTHGPKPKGLVTFVAVNPDGHNLGHVHERQAAPKPAAEKKKPAPASASAPSADADDDAPPPASGRGPITQAGLELIAKAQTQALQQHMRTIAPSLDEAELLELLLLTLCSDNVTITGASAGAYALRIAFDDVSSTLLDPQAKQREMAPLQARHLAGDVIARCLVMTTRGGRGGSGAPAHWLGQWIGAEAAMPRLDTPEILATLSLDTLREAAFAAGLKPAGTAKALREQLAGYAPALTLPQAAFGTPGPQPRTHSQEDGNDD